MNFKSAMQSELFTESCKITSACQVPAESKLFQSIPWVNRFWAAMFFSQENIPDCSAPWKPSLSAYLLLGCTEAENQMVLATLWVLNYLEKFFFLPPLEHCITLIYVGRREKPLICCSFEFTVSARCCDGTCSIPINKTDPKYPPL